MNEVLVLRMARVTKRQPLPARILTVWEAEMLNLATEVTEVRTRAGIDVLHFRKGIAQDFIRIVESGESLALPTHLLTAKQAEILIHYVTRKQ